MSPAADYGRRRNGRSTRTVVPTRGIRNFGPGYRRQAVQCFSCVPGPWNRLDFEPAGFRLLSYRAWVDLHLDDEVAVVGEVCLGRRPRYGAWHRLSRCSATHVCCHSRSSHGRRRLDDIGPLRRSGATPQTGSPQRDDDDEERQSEPAHHPSPMPWHAFRCACR